MGDGHWLDLEGLQLSPTARPETVGVSFGDVVLECSLAGVDPGHIAPVVNLAELIKSSALPRPVTIAVAVARSDDAIQWISQILRPSLSTSRARPPIPRVVESPIGRSHRLVTLLEFATRPEFDDSYCIVVYDPENLRALAVVREAHRRAAYSINELLLDLSLGHLDTVALHASAVDSDTAGVLIAGPSGSGKTSIMLELLHRGAAFISDDIVVLSDENALLPFEHKELTLRLSTLRRLVSRGVVTPGELPLHGDEAYAYASRLFPGQAAVGPRLAAVVLPEFAPGRVAAVELLSRWRAERLLSDLLLPWCMRWENAFGIRGRQLGARRRLARAIEPVHAFMRVRHGGDIERAADQLLTELARQGIVHA